MIENAIAYETSRVPRVNRISDLTEVKPSSIAGMGLFAKNFIPKGTLWWSGNNGDVFLISRDQFQTLECSVESPMIKQLKDSILNYSYYVDIYDALVLCLDNARFVNHSFEPNSGPAIDPETLMVDPLASMATRDIYPGEEIFEDYTAYDRCPWTKTCEGFLDQSTHKFIHHQ